MNRIRFGRRVEMHNYSKWLHNDVKRKAERSHGVSLTELKPNEKEIAKRLLKQGALFSVGGKLMWQGD